MFVVSERRYDMLSAPPPLPLCVYNRPPPVTRPDVPARASTDCDIAMDVISNGKSAECAWNIRKLLVTLQKMNRD